MRAFAGNSFEDYYDHAMRDFPLPARLVCAALVRVVWAFTKLVWPWRIEGAERLCADGRGRVIVMNHESMLDPVALVCELWMRGVHVRPVYKSEFDGVPLASWLFSRVGALPVSRGTADMKMVRRARAALQRGECVLIYPEGTRVKRDADSEVHGGFALMAQLAKVPVQPVAIIGARHLRLRSHVAIRVGEPVEWDELPEGSRKERVAAMEREGMRRVWELRDALRADNPGMEQGR